MAANKYFIMSGCRSCNKLLQIVLEKGPSDFSCFHHVFPVVFFSFSLFNVAPASF